MKIALVNDTFLYGRGADTVIYELAKRLGRKHDVYVLAGETNIKEENFKFIKINLPKLFTGKIGDFNFFYNMLKLRRQIKKIQRFHHFDIFNLFHSALNVSFTGFPAIVTWLGSPQTKNFFRRALNKMLLVTLKKNLKTVTISKYLRKNIGFLENVEVIYCGISREFSPAKKEINKNYMLYIGRLERHKNIGEIIKLSKILNFPLKIGGYGSEEKKLKNMAKIISAPVEFLGFVARDNLIRLYRECSFFISASRWEGFGLIFAEAGACGKPSIAYRIGSIPEVISDEETGFLANNSMELKQGAEMLIKNPKIRQKMGKNALIFGRKFSWEKSAEEYEKIFYKVIQK